MIALEAIDRYRDSLLRDLEQLVKMNSFSSDKADVERVGSRIRELLTAAGCSCQVHPGGMYADSLACSVTGRGSIRIMMLGHMDTVHPREAAARMGYRIDGNILRGPGTVDMKAGILVGCYAIRLLRDHAYDAFGRLTLVVNGDEEIGSPSSRAFIEELAQQHDVVLVLEGARTRREIIGTRKGVGRYELTVEGKAAHAGVEPELGRSALTELAHQIIALQALNSPETGTTVNVCMAHSGVAANVIPPLATATIDVRVLNAAEADRIDSAIRAQAERTTVPDVRCTVTGGFNRPPLEKSATSAKLISITQEIARALGCELTEIVMGGGSDGNFTAALGIPTLDGMGPDGGLSHSENEFLELSSIWERLAILLRVIEYLSENGLPE